MASLFDDPDVLRSKLLRERMVQGGGTAESAILANASNVGTNLGYGIARLFGREMPEVQAAEKKQQVMQDVLESTDADGNPYTFGSLEFYDNVSQKLLDAGLMEEAFQVGQIRNKQAIALQSAEDKKLDRQLKEKRVDNITSQIENREATRKRAEKALIRQDLANADKLGFKTPQFTKDIDNAIRNWANKDKENKNWYTKVTEGYDDKTDRGTPGMAIDENDQLKIREESLGIGSVWDGKNYIGTTTEQALHAQVRNEVARRLKVEGATGSPAEVAEQVIQELQQGTTFEPIYDVDRFGLGGDDAPYYKPNLSTQFSGVKPPGEPLDDNEMELEKAAVIDEVNKGIESGTDLTQVKQKIQKGIIIEEYPAAQEEELLNHLDSIIDEREKLY